MTTEALPVVEPPFDGAEGQSVDGAKGQLADSAAGESVDESASVVGVVLAAGTSSRFGDENKLLATWNGDPLVRHAIRTLCQSAVDTVVVVVGHESERVRDAIADLDVTVVHNDAHERGQATSVREGVAAARERDGAATLFALGDMPSVTVESVDRLVEAYRAGVGDALAVACDGVRGNPVLFDARHFDALANVTGDVGGREILLGGDRSALVETRDPGVLVDVDRPADLADL